MDDIFLPPSQLINFTLILDLFRLKSNTQTVYIKVTHSFMLLFVGKLILFLLYFSFFFPHYTFKSIFTDKDELYVHRSIYMSLCG